MIKKLTILCFSVVLFATDTLQLGHKDDVIVYAVELFVSSSLEGAKSILEEVPARLRKETHLYYKNKHFIEGRYSQSSVSEDLIPYLKEFHKAGFDDAYIIKSTKQYMKKSLINLSHEKRVQYREKPTHAPLSGFSKSNLIVTAQKAYEDGDDDKAITYFEMLLAAGDKNRKIENNLCYLYGKRGAWLQAKAILDNERYHGDLVYAYAYGAVQNNIKSFFDDLSEYIMFDRSGHLLLLGGYLSEKLGEGKQAFSYYKKAYEKNPSDVYNLYAYARIWDIQKDYSKALSLYSKVLEKVNKDNLLYKSVYNRKMQLKR